MQDVYWRITKDTGNEPEESRVGWEGPRDCNRKLPTPVRFRMMTDDWPEERAAYYGVAANDESVEYAFDGLGVPDFGFSRVDIWDKEQHKYTPFIG